MKLIVCVDNKMGLVFNNRRQSRDEKLIMDMLELTGDAIIWMDSRSVALFENFSGTNRCRSWQGQAMGREDYFFSEFGIMTEENPEEIVLYRWNRTYPGDAKLTIDLKKLKCIESKEFAGKSHECITREIYVRS